MDLANWNPITIGVCAGVFAVLAAGLTVLANYITQTRQSGNTSAIRQELKDQTELLRGLAVRSGDSQALADAIEVRSRVLAEGRSPAASEIQQILADVPRLSKEYGKLQQSRASAEQQNLDAYRLRWEALVSVVIDEFDKRLASVLASGIKADLAKDSFKIAGVDQDGGKGQLVRSATRNGVELRLYVGSAQIHSDRVEDGSLGVTVRIPARPLNESNPISARLSLTEASLSVEGAKVAPNSPSDIQLRDAMFAGINKGIETWLVVSNSKK